MNKYKILSISTLALLAFNCNDKDKSAENLFTFNGEALKAQYQPTDKVILEVANPQKKTIDSIVYYINEKNAGSVKGHGRIEFNLTGLKFGYQNLKALVYFEGENAETTERIEIVSDVQPKLLTYTVVNTYPHDMTSFTEGLEFYRDTLYESGGQYGNSRIFKYDYKTGKIFKNQELEKKYFGEGLTIFNNKIYLLTYKENTGFIFNANTWKLEKTFTFDKKIEGWGMTNDGKNLYQSDGTEKIWTMNPESQKMIDYINVYSSSSKIKSINELEFVNGKFYGNIWQKDAIAVINPATGAVEGVINLADLRKELKAPNAEVLNGIAYNPKTKTIFVTGKYWDKLFEIRVTE
ncbi:MAG TPA: glutaminyl-peptide cyclotransferase [Flavobacterium sp.]|jgi:glutamine cyclotransferase